MHCGRNTTSQTYTAMPNVLLQYLCTYTYWCTYYLTNVTEDVSAIHPEDTGTTARTAVVYLVTPSYQIING